MNEAKRFIDSAKIDPEQATCIIADEQTQGRGTYGKSWASPAGAGIYMSFIRSLTLMSSSSVISLAMNNSNYTVDAGRACVEALNEVLDLLLSENFGPDWANNLGIKIEQKPINDIYANNCKLGGILTETKLGQSAKIANKNISNGGQNLFLITGIGINILDTKKYLKEHMIEMPKASPISLQELIPEQYFQNFSCAALIDKLIEKLCYIPDSSIILSN